MDKSMLIWRPEESHEGVWTNQVRFENRACALDINEEVYLDVAYPRPVNS